ncbi:2-oxoglutarate dehydrogenase E1 component [Posidoniimonas corsicana]|uniref:oxoglutarate dehydrogenase (succinyl-transferring) n=1 Tax=Posidoniimonas corsicana TaxID=1938618 RepID=A0A5C5VAN9_9BACT|nr:2-oxoglutarate dehydrogenase E1 component [Posidoniimonas corsicana]TWT35628.1 2-oxoglutarate dehydrogenase E1 component [Posidoniimonas corsicana]
MPEPGAESNTLVQRNRTAVSNHPPFPPTSIFNPPVLAARDHGSARLQHGVDRLVADYRDRGHLAAKLDPLGLSERGGDLFQLGEYGLSTDDDSESVLLSTAGRQAPTSVQLGELRQRLTDTYCQWVGYEYSHLRDADARAWLQNRIENQQGADAPAELQRRVLTQLSRAVTFERFVRKKYLGSKTFSLEGAETLITLLDLALDNAAGHGVAEVVIGMAHRGRLNVLANIVGKPPEEIFREFEDQHPDWWRGRGDVKYHLGASGEWTGSNGADVHISLCFNPSHLEFINPIALGRIRAKQDRVGDADRTRGVTVLIHGDAGFAGEGIVQETLNLTGLDDYRTGGTLHVVVNNQLGFTTGPSEGRSTEYATDIARAYDIPVFHVNGDQPLAVASVVRLAMEFRARFQRDVVVDLYCYRRWGHNEADEPTFTQPVMYDAVESRDSIYDAYRDRLVETGVVTRAEADQHAEQTRAELEEHYQAAQQKTAQPHEPPLGGVWQDYRGGAADDDECETAVDAGQLKELIEKITTFPDGFHLHPKLQRSVQQRKLIAEQEAPVDWATAESLAIASLATEGAPVRLSGQDSGRGTFSHRHALLHDAEDGRRINIFSNLADQQGEVQIINSPLCEGASLGFEYGYSLDYPGALVVWEAQFGDFANAGQVIIDQFISSAEDKWRRLSGLVLLLPHGFEGQGPEHSSARLERFLTLAAEDNIQVACPTTPAQYFHLLRRQVERPWRKPLVVLTHKSLLRHPRMASSLDELSGGGFRPILADDRPAASETSRILMSSGKMAYDLLEAREERGRSDVAIVRVEQFYPLSDAQLADTLRPYEDGARVVWVQEEPENMGAWPYWRQRCCDRIADRFPFSCVSRESSASPATGSSAAHKDEQQELIEQAFNT